MSEYDPIDYRYLCEVQDTAIVRLKDEVERLKERWGESVAEEADKGCADVVTATDKHVRRPPGCAYGAGH